MTRGLIICNNCKFLGTSEWHDPICTLKDIDPEGIRVCSEKEFNYD